MDGFPIQLRPGITGVVGALFLGVKSAHPLGRGHAAQCPPAGLHYFQHQAGKNPAGNPQAAKAVPSPALAGTGWKGTAFVWKWIIQRGGIASLLQTYGLMLVTFGAVCFLIPWLKKEFPERSASAPNLIAMLSALFGYVMGITILFVTPIKIAQGLRIDLNHSEILLTLPIKPRDAILGTILGPLAHAGILWTLGILGIGLLFAVVGFPSSNRVDWLEFFPAAMLGCLLMGMGILAASTLVQVLLVLFFPAWQPAQNRAKGSMDNMGVGCLSAIGLLMLLLLNIAAAVGSGILAYRVLGYRNPLEVLAFCTVVMVVLWATEFWLLLKLCIGAWHRYDPTEKSAGIGTRSQ
jgi:hypothetical protein